MSVIVIETGPFFDGRDAEAIARGTERTRVAVSDKALAEWHAGMESTFRHPTPYYETQVTNQIIGDANVVHDRGIVYGPWLEGVGSRNRTTRFKGYFNLRRAKSIAEAEAVDIGNRIFAEVLHDG